MLATVEGIYKDGKIELAETPQNIRENMPVIVTFLGSHSIDLGERGITKEQAAHLRNQLAAFSEDWDMPEMELYDNYESASS